MHLNITIKPSEHTEVHKEIGNYLDLIWRGASLKCFQRLVIKPYLSGSVTDDILPLGMVFAIVALVYFLSGIMSLRQIPNQTDLSNLGNLE